MEIGDDNIFESFVSIGAPAEHKTEPTHGGVKIGSRNKINQFVTVNAALKGLTLIGNDCYIMRGVHIGHDGIVEDHVVLSCNVIVGGHSHVMAHTNMGLASVIHQLRVVGPYAMVGMNSTVTKNIPPFCTAMGSPCKPKHANIRGLERNGFTPEEIHIIEKIWATEDEPGNKKINDIWGTWLEACTRMGF